MTIDLDGVAGLAVAILGGAAVGAERQRSGHASGPDARLGGLRTFTLLGALAGVAGLLITNGLTMSAAALLAGGAGLIVAGYVRASEKDVDATTEVAALVVLGAGVLAGLGELRVAAGLTTLIVLVLVEKTTLHRAVKKIDDKTMMAAIRFAVMSLVILPLLPEGPIGPGGGIRPRELWMLVLLFSGLSFAGYLAQRLAGAAGYPLIGMLGGLVSSTSVTLTFARLSARHASQSAALATGAVAASAVLFMRVAVVVAILDAALLPALAWWIVAPCAAGFIAAIVLWRTASAGESTAPELHNPLQIRSALEMAALFQVVLFGVHAVHDRLGETGLIPSAMVLGLTDVDALTMAMTKSAPEGTTLEAAARAIAAGIFANTTLKAVVAIAVGARPYGWRVALSLAAVASTIVVTWVLGH